MLSNSLILHVVVVVGFEQPTYIVDEDVGQFEVCVVATIPSQPGLLNYTFNLSLSTIRGVAGTYFASQTCSHYIIVWRNDVSYMFWPHTQLEGAKN